MVKEINKETLKQKIYNTIVANQLVETIYVDNIVGVIETENSIKENGILKNKTDTIDYKLKSHRLLAKGKNYDIIISDIPCNKTIFKNKLLCDLLSNDINKIFLSYIEEVSEKNEFIFFKQNLINRILNKKTKEHLINEILKIGRDCSWAIIPISIFNIIKNSKLFLKNDIDSESLIYNVGTLSALKIYLNTKEDNIPIIHFGNYDSMKFLINKDIDIVYNNNSSSITINYLFLLSGILKSMTIK